MHGKTYDWSARIVIVSCLLSKTVITGMDDISVDKGMQMVYHINASLAPIGRATLL